MYDSGCASVKGYAFTASVNGVVYWIEEKQWATSAELSVVGGTCVVRTRTDGERFGMGALRGAVCAFAARIECDEMFKK